MRRSLLAVFLFIAGTMRQGEAQTGTAGDWRPPPQAKINQPGEATYVQTPGDGLYNHSWYMIEDRRQFVFEVKTCRGAMLAFATHANGPQEYLIEIALGTSDNTMAEIRDPMASPTVPGYFTTYAPRVVHCNEFRFFWIRWGGGNFRVGRGPAVNEQEFMQWTDPLNRYFDSISLTSAEGSAAVWKISENSGSHQFVHTFGSQRYSTLWKSVETKNFWSFGLLPSAGRGHVILTENLGSTEGEVYEFVIGSSAAFNRIFLRTAAEGGMDTIVADVTLDGVVNATQGREFWISWFNGQIELGMGGYYGQRRLLMYKNPRPISVRYLSLASGNESYARWWYMDEQESINYVFTSPTDSLDPNIVYNGTWVVTPRQEYFKFELKTCKEAYIVLSSQLNPLSNSLEIIIGMDGNTRSVLRYLSQTTNLAEASTPNLLLCDEPRNFWISWHNRTISLGHSMVFGVGTLFSYTVADPGVNGFLIGGIGLSTPNNPGEWRIRESVGERIQVRTGTVYNHFDRFWRSVNQQKYITFRVRACSDCHMALSPVLGVDPTEPYYDMVIGGYTNNYALLERIVGNDRALMGEMVNTGNVLNCDSHVDLWISWENGQIAMGWGILANFNHLFTFNGSSINDSFPIKAVGFSTGFHTGNNDGDFIVDEDSSDYFMFYTSLDDKIRWLEFEPTITWIPVRVRSCEQVYLFLCPTQDVDNCYNITLSNDRSSIIARGQIPIDVATPNFLSCRDNRNFWFRWSSLGRLDIGHGTIPGVVNSTFLTAIITTPIAVNFAGFQSTAEDTFARFQIDKNAVKAIAFHTPQHMLNYEQMWETVERARGIIFGITACNDIHVILSPKLRYWDETTLHIVYGGWSNTRSAIRNYLDARVWSDVSTPGICSCTERRYFWITWQYGTIETGRGQVVGMDRIMVHHPLMMYPVNAVGYSTGFGANGTWYIPVASSLLPTIRPVTPVPTTPTPLLQQAKSTPPETVAGAVLGVVAVVLVVLILVLYNRTRGNTPSTTGGGQAASVSGFDNPAATVVQRQASKASSSGAPSDAVELDELDNE